MGHEIYIEENVNREHPCLVSGFGSSPDLRYLNDFDIKKLIALGYNIISTVDPDREILRVIEITRPDVECDVCQVQDSSKRQKILPAASRIYYKDGGQRFVCNQHYNLTAEVKKYERVSPSLKIRCDLCSKEKSTYPFLAEIKITYTNELVRFVCYRHRDILNGNADKEVRNEFGWIIK